MAKKVIKKSKSVSMTEADWKWLMKQASDKDRSVSWVICELIRKEKEEAS